MPVSEVIKGLDKAGSEVTANSSVAREFLIRAGIVDSATGALTKHYQ